MRALILSLILFFSAFLMSVVAQETLILDQKFWMANGPVNDMVKKNNELILGGIFTYVGPVNGNGGMVDLEDGILAPDFPFLNNRVLAVVDDGTGGWFVGGAFTKVGNDELKYLVHILADGSVEEDFQFNLDGKVTTLFRNENRLFIGGKFQEVDGVPRNRFAAIDIDTNLLTDFFVEATSGFIRNDIIAMQVFEGKLYLGGTFAMVNNMDRQLLAAVDLTTGELTDWSPTVSGLGLARILTLHIADGKLYAGGWFTTINGEARSNIAAFDLNNGQLLAWAPAPSGFVEDILLYEDIVFIAGDFFTVNNQPQSFLAGLDKVDGELIEWQPFTETTVNRSVNDLAINGERLFIAGNFKSANGIKQNNLAAFDLSTLELADWKASCSERAAKIVLSDQLAFIGGSFKSLGGKDRVGMAAIDLQTGIATDWEMDIDQEGISFGSAVRTLLLDAEDLYVAGNFKSIGGLPRPSFAHINLSQNTVTNLQVFFDENNASPKSITELAMFEGGGSLYLGGTFAGISGESIHNLAGLSLNTGSIIPWSPNPDSSVTDLSIKNGILYVAGEFQNISSELRDGLAAFEISSGVLTDFAPSVKIDCSGQIGATGGGPCGGALIDTIAIIPGRVFNVFATDQALFISGIWTHLLQEEKQSFASIEISAQTLTSFEQLALVTDFNLVNNLLYMTGSFQEDSTDFARASIGILDLNNNIIKRYNLDQTNSSLRKIVNSENYLFLSGVVINREEGVNRNYAVIPSDQVNANSESLPSTYNINVYPNPAKNDFYIHLQTAVGLTVELELFNALGQLVHQQSLGRFSRQSILLNYDFLTKGIYYARFWNGKEAVLKKLIVQ